MKTQLLYLDPEDDRASVLEKIRWSHAERVVLVWPGRGHPLTDYLDLVLLDRAAKRNRAQLGIASLDPDVVQNAKALHLPLVSDLERVESANWDRSSAMRAERVWRQPRRPPKPSANGARKIAPWARVAWLLGVVLALALLAVILLPSAEIVVQPRTEVIETTLRFDGSRASFAAADQPALYRQERITLRRSLRIPTSGLTARPAQAATGFVTFTNLTPDSFDIPAGTGLRSSTRPGLRFETTARAQMPAQEGAQVEVPIRALQAGPEGNLQPGEIDRIDGPFGLSLTASNAAPLAGGANEAASAVSLSDARSLRTALEDQLTSAALEQFAQRLATGEVLLPETLALSNVEEAFDHAVGEAAETVALEMTADVEVGLYNQLQLEEAVLKRLKAGLPGNYQLVPASIQIRGVRVGADSGEDHIVLSVPVSARRARIIDPLPVASAIAGQTAQQAIATIQHMMPIEGSPRILIRPSWFPRLPLLPVQIEIRFDWASP